MNSFEPLVMYDNADSWSMHDRQFNRICGRFKLMPQANSHIFSGIENRSLESVRIIEKGPVRAIVEAIFSYRDSYICHRYKIPCFGTEFEMESSVQWNEKDRMLKLAIPVCGQNNQYMGQVAYGVQTLPNNGDEAMSQKWAAIVLKESNIAITCINNGVYGSDYSPKGLRLTLLRSPAYSAYPSVKNNTIVPQDRYSDRMDQGCHKFNFWFNAGEITDRLKKIDREALVKNEPPFVLSFFPDGLGNMPKPFIILKDQAIQITTVKKAENSNDIIVRLFEPTGRKRKTLISMPFLENEIELSFSKFEIKTIRINPRTKRWVEVDLMEGSY